MNCLPANHELPKGQSLSSYVAELNKPPFRATDSEQLLWQAVKSKRKRALKQRSLKKPTKYAPISQHQDGYDLVFKESHLLKGGVL